LGVDELLAAAEVEASLPVTEVDEATVEIPEGPSVIMLSAGCVPDGEEEDAEDESDTIDASEVDVAEANTVSGVDEAVDATVLVDAACLPLGPQPSR
jgi:hypothetical protein